MKTSLIGELSTIRESGLYKDEKIITSQQNSVVETDHGRLINFCSNNYLGLANHPEILATVSQGLITHGFGMASVRFICGTQNVHRELENRITNFLGTEGTILYNSCFDANAGLFETILGPDDAVISDALNHASIIDGIRLCKAQRKVYKHSDMRDLEEKLKQVEGSRFRLIATDGIFSMQGDSAPLDEICVLADKHDALVMVDDSHATAFLGPDGRGTPTEYGVAERVDIITSTMDKALGGASGGFISGHKEIVDILRQRSRPYLFSNTLAPPIVLGVLKAFDLLERNPDLRTRLMENTRYFRNEMESLGFNIFPSRHAIVAVMLGDERKTGELTRLVNQRGIFVVGFTFPVVPREQGRIRVQISSAHTREQIDTALSAFETSGREMSII